MGMVELGEAARHCQPVFGHAAVAMKDVWGSEVSRKMKSIHLINIGYIVPSVLAWNVFVHHTMGDRGIDDRLTRQKKRLGRFEKTCSTYLFFKSARCLYKEDFESNGVLWFQVIEPKFYSSRMIGI